LWKRKEFDLVHFHGASLPLIINLPLLKALGKKVVAKVSSTSLGIEPGSLKGRYLGLGSLLTRLLKRVDAFIALTSEIENNLIQERIPAGRVIKIPNFIDFRKFSPCSEETKRGKKAEMGFGDSRLVTFTGRFIECKGISHLLYAWKEVIARSPKAKLLLLGDGPLLGRMRDLAASLNIDGSVIIKGYVENVIDYLHISDIYVFPSIQEGMPNALLEAMACGLPPVATRISGVVDLIDNRENGILVEPGDAQGLAKGILLLLENSEEARRVSAAAFKKISSSYSLDAIVFHYLKLYEELMER
jgi:glycosyltransferase involved in cell wall biosynthesis